jgi:hypothetical protein
LGVFQQVKLLFAGEQKLCDEIWSQLDPYREKCFADVTDTSVHMLLSFGEAIAKSKKSPEKLFVLLDMYETLHDLQPEVPIAPLLLPVVVTYLSFFSLRFSLTWLVLISSESM